MVDEFDIDMNWPTIYGAGEILRSTRCEKCGKIDILLLPCDQPVTCEACQKFELEHKEDE